MIDAIHPVASWFLWIAGISFLLVFAIPILVAPLNWARIFPWRLPQDTGLTVYFGRCLGAVAMAIIVVCLRAVPHPADNAIVFEIVIVACALLAAVHVWGAIRGTQPWTETAEIALYGGVTAAAIWIYTGL